MCWPALLLVCIAETTTGTTCNNIADELDLLTLGASTGPAGTFRQTAELTKTQRDLFAKLSIRPTGKIIETTQPRPPDQQQHHRLVTRPVTPPARVRAGQTMDPSPSGRSWRQ